MRKRIALHSPWTSRIPGSKALSDDQKVSPESFATRLVEDQQPAGLTAADGQSFVDDIKKHPEVSAALLEESGTEAAS